MFVAQVRCLDLIGLTGSKSMFFFFFSQVLQDFSKSISQILAAVQCQCRVCLCVCWGVLVFSIIFQGGLKLMVFDAVDRTQPKALGARRILRVLAASSC